MGPLLHIQVKVSRTWTPACSSCQESFPAKLSPKGGVPSPRDYSNASGISLLIQWLRLPVLKAGGPGSIPGQGTRSHMPQLRVFMPQRRSKIPHSTAKTWHSQNKVNKGFFFFKLTNNNKNQCCRANHGNNNIHPKSRVPQVSQPRTDQNVISSLSFLTSKLDLTLQRTHH